MRTKKIRRYLVDISIHRVTTVTIAVYKSRKPSKITEEMSQRAFDEYDRVMDLDYLRHLEKFGHTKDLISEGVFMTVIDSVTATEATLPDPKEVARMM